jgi:hypothetical protein
LKEYIDALTLLLNYQHGMDVNRLPVKCTSENMDVKKLIENVKGRKVRLGRANRDDCLKCSYLRFDVLEKIPKIEDLMWERNKTQKLWHVGSFRDRMFFLFTKNGLLRGESLIRAELSDLFDFIKSDEGPPGHDGRILILQMLEGKANAGKTVWGRVMRHRDVAMCAIGGLGLYLLAWFEHTKEEIDITENGKWFTRKLLINPAKKSDHCKEMSYQNYAKVLEEVCDMLGIVSDKKMHFGRHYGSMDGEMQDLDAESLTNLGNLVRDVQEAC